MLTANCVFDLISPCHSNYLGYNSTVWSCTSGQLKILPNVNWKDYSTSILLIETSENSGLTILEGLLPTCLGKLQVFHGDIWGVWIPILHIHNQSCHRLLT